MGRPAPPGEGWYKPPGAYKYHYYIPGDVTDPALFADALCTTRSDPVRVEDLERRRGRDADGNCANCIRHLKWRMRARSEATQKQKLRAARDEAIDGLQRARAARLGMADRRVIPRAPGGDRGE